MRRPRASPRAGSPAVDEHPIAILHNLRRRRALILVDAFNVVFTDRRAIFARMTGPRLRRAIVEANAAGKAAGQGALSRWGGQLAACARFGDRYLEMSPDDVLREEPANFAVPLEEIHALRFRKVHPPRRRGQVVVRVHGRVDVETRRGRLRFSTDGYPTEDVETLQRVLGAKVVA